MEKTRLEIRIKECINIEGREADSDTPDFILAEYLLACLDAFEMASNQRDAHYGLPQDMAAGFTDKDNLQAKTDG